MKVAVVDLNPHSYEEFEAEAKDMTGDSTVAEIEALGGSGRSRTVRRSSSSSLPTCPTM